MIQVLKQVLRLPKRSDLVVECRQCGANLDSEDVDSCPECGSTEVVTYQL